MPAKPMPDWRRVEKLIQKVFKRTPGVKVKSDAVVKGKSGSQRKLELWVTVPFPITFAEHFSLTLPLKIGVDCKAHSKPVGIKKLEEFLGQLEDVGAHAGILVSTMGFDKGARRRAKGYPVYLVDAPRDILFLARGLTTPECFLCKCCQEATEGRDGMPGVVQWHLTTGENHEPSIGSCDWCNAPHVMCPDCASVVGFLESEYGSWIQCVGCERMFLASRSRDGDVDDIESVGDMERRLLEVALQTDEGLTAAAVKKIMSGTKWQYASTAIHPVARLVARGWATRDEMDETLRLTDDGREFANNGLRNVKDSMYGW